MRHDDVRVIQVYVIGRPDASGDLPSPLHRAPKPLQRRQRHERLAARASCAASNEDAGGDLPSRAHRAPKQGSYSAAGGPAASTLRLRRSLQPPRHRDGRCGGERRAADKSRSCCCSAQAADLWCPAAIRPQLGPPRVMLARRSYLKVESGGCICSLTSSALPPAPTSGS